MGYQAVRNEYIEDKTRNHMPFVNGLHQPKPDDRGS